VRVLFATHTLRHQYLRSFVEYAQRQAGWRIGIISDKQWSGFFAGLENVVEAFFPLPDAVEEAPWESDAGALARLRSRIAACERATGTPLNRIVLTGERRLGRAYGREFYHWAATTESRLALRDNRLPERMVMRLFAAVDTAIEQFRPDLVLLGQTASPDCFALSLLAEMLGIPVAINRPSKILSERCFWTRDREMLNTAAATLCREKIDCGARPSAAAREHLQAFRDTPRPIAYIQRNWDIAAAKTFLASHIDLAGRAIRAAHWRAKGRRGRAPKPVLSKVVEIYRGTYLRARQARYFRSFDETELSSLRYVYLALHKEPELAINFQAPFWHSQKNLIAWLSMNLPCGYRLLVRDHRKNDGRRPMAFYRDIVAYPGVQLVSPFDSQFKYVRNAALIVSDNGTTGWEGLVFGRPVLSLARNFYTPAELAAELRDPSKLGETMIQCLTSPRELDEGERERRLACLVEAEMETTVEESAASHDESLSILSDLCAGRVADPTRTRAATAALP
jgi:hypothetical protein